jgi:hypothetical protein
MFPASSIIVSATSTGSTSSDAQNICEYDRPVCVSM